jgi:CHAT domain-containing protein/tetratricopeptide (TPR) repeat protein
LTDLGSAYFERAESASRAIDYGNAIEAFGKALVKAPNDPVALYNRALACERMFLYIQAVDDWEHYLRVDPNGEWADDVRKKLETIKEKVRKHSENEKEPLWDVGTFSTRLSAEIGAEVGRRGEDYLQQATSAWMVELFSPSKRRKSEALKALRILGRSLSALHSDDWLTDVVASTSSPEMAKASSFLSQAIEADMTGNYDDGQVLARDAKFEFQKSGSIAGALRSQVELVYALDRASQSQECLREAADLRDRIKPHRYAWIEVQAATEGATCLLIAGSSVDPRPEAREAMKLAKAAGYKNLYLRAWSNAISIDSIRGDFEKAWNEGVEALASYWREPYPPARAFQLCSELAFAAEDTGLLHASLQLSREALTAVSKTHNRAVQATEHYRVASLASDVGLRREAEEHFRAADQLLASIPKSRTTRGFRVDAETWLASMEADRENIDIAQGLLDQARPDLDLVPTLTVPLRFYATEGTVSLARGEYDDAERALRGAIYVAEAGASSMRTTRERILWNNEVRSAYRSLAAVRFQHYSDVHGALDVWEAYRALVLHRPPERSYGGKFEGIDFKVAETGPALLDMNLVERVRPKLDRSMAVSYEVTKKGVIIWAFDDHAVASAWSPIAESELEDVVRSFILQCSTPYSDRKVLDDNSRRLYNLLVKPIRGSLRPDRALMVELDESLSGLPIEALVDETGTFLGDAFIISKSPGIGFLESMRENHSFVKDSPALIVGPPALMASDPTLQSIPDATAEARDLASVLSNSQLLIGPDATLPALQFRLPRVEILHFAGHALSYEQSSGLLLATPVNSGSTAKRTATLLSTSSLDLKDTNDLQLVVLAACSTGITARGTKLSPDNLVLPFIASGVPHVVATLWDVNSGATATLIRSFYRHLLTGNSVADSLQRAKTELRRNPLMSHPYYWAGFTAFGRT